MRERVMPRSRTVLDRALLDPSLDVTVALVSEFNRSLPGSGHATILSAPMFGRSLARGTTGRIADDGRVALAASATLAVPRSTCVSWSMPTHHPP